MNFGQTAKSVLASVAPVIGTALGGPFGGLAGSLLAKALGTSDPKSMEAAITSTDPDILLKLKQADNDFKAHMADLGIQEEQLQVQDREGARSREVALRDWTPTLLAYLITTGFFGVLAYMIRFGTPAGAGGEAFLLLLGALATAWTGIIAYYFGSSAGSASKTDAINKIIASK